MQTLAVPNLFVRLYAGKHQYMLYLLSMSLLITLVLRSWMHMQVKLCMPVFCVFVVGGGYIYEVCSKASRVVASVHMNGLTCVSITTILTELSDSVCTMHWNNKLQHAHSQCIHALVMSQQEKLFSHWHKGHIKQCSHPSLTLAPTAAWRESGQQPSVLQEKGEEGAVGVHPALCFLFVVSQAE